MKSDDGKTKQPLYDDDDGVNNNVGGNRNSGAKPRRTLAESAQNRGSQRLSLNAFEEVKVYQKETDEVTLEALDGTMKVRSLPMSM